MPRIASDRAALRIGELARRTGIPADTLRAWERRYELLSPVRTASGHRLYSERDEATITRMRAHLADGLSAAQAAEAARREEPPGADPVPDGESGARSTSELVMSLVNALDNFDEATAHRSLDDLVHTTSVDRMVGEVFLPYLRKLGERWARGEITVAQEHFASGVIREHLTGLARDLGAGTGPHALLACAPGELHDLGLLCFAVALRNRDWRVTVLGASTPAETIAATADRLRPDAVIIAAVDRDHLMAPAGTLRALATAVPLHLGGAGADEEIARLIGASHLAGDLLAAADQLALSAS